MRGNMQAERDGKHAEWASHTPDPLTLHITTENWLTSIKCYNRLSLADSALSRCPSVSLCDWPSLDAVGTVIPIQTSPNWPLPNRFKRCSDSRGISHTSLVFIDRSVRRGIPLWHGPTNRKHRPDARSEAGKALSTCKHTHVYIQIKKT